MRLLLLVLLVSAGIWSVSPVLADQTDPRLDNLFRILQSSDQQIELRAAENLIWATWLQHDNTEYERLMRRGAQAMGERAMIRRSGYSQVLSRKPRTTRKPGTSGPLSIFG